MDNVRGGFTGEDIGDISSPKGKKKSKKFRKMEERLGEKKKKVFFLGCENEKLVIYLLPLKSSSKSATVFCLLMARGKLQG